MGSNTGDATGLVYYCVHTYGGWFDWLIPRVAILVHSWNTGASLS